MPAFITFLVIKDPFQANPMSTSRKILILANKFPYPENDGGAIAMMSMIRGFAYEGHEVTVLAMNTHKHYVDLDNIPKEIKNLAQFYAVDVDIRIKPWPALKNLLLSQKPYHIQRFTAQGYSLQLARLLKENTYDLIQLEGLYLSPYIDLIREDSPQTPVVLRAHNIEHEIWDRQAQKASSRLRKRYLEETAKRIRTYQETLLWEKAYDAIIPITARDASKLEKMGVSSTPLHVSTAGFDLNKIEENKDIEVEFPSLFYIGALDWAPNQEGMKWFFKEVWPILHKRYPELNFYLAGRRMPANFSNMAPDDNVKVLGEVDDAYSYMSSKAIMVVPLLSGGGMRVKIVEGMALGKAIVASSIAAEGIPVNHGEHIMIADEPIDFANAISVLVEQKGMVEVLGKNAQKMIQTQFSNRQIVKELLAFYEENFFDAAAEEEGGFSDEGPDDDQWAEILRKMAE